LLGYRVAVNPKITIAHHFRESRGYEVDDVEVTSNFVRMLHLHFSPSRIEQVLQHLAGNPFLQPALHLIHRSDVFEVRSTFESRRIHDDDWFFTRVNPVRI
jgi:hypothetical protein